MENTAIFFDYARVKIEGEGRAGVPRADLV